MRNWALQDAKARLSELIKQTQLEGPQAITVRGQPMVVILSQREFTQLVTPKPSFVDFLLHSPLAGVDLSIQRDKSVGRDIEL